MNFPPETKLSYFIKLMSLVVGLAKTNLWRAWMSISRLRVDGPNQGVKLYIF